MRCWTSSASQFGPVCNTPGTRGRRPRRARLRKTRLPSAATWPYLAPEVVATSRRVRQTQMDRQRFNPLIITQGKLCPSASESALPLATWRQEFDAAADAGLDGIAWLFDDDRLSDNPMWSAEGRRDIRQQIRSSGILVTTIVAPYFTSHPLTSDSDAVRLQNAAMLRRLLHDASDVGAAHVVLPLPPSAVDGDESIDGLSRSLETSLPHAERLGVQICVEVVGAPKPLQHLVARLAHRSFRLCYDTRSAFSRDVDLCEDVEPIRAHLALVALSRPSVAPSEHSPKRRTSNYEAFFRSLLEAQFRGPFILRHKFDRPETDAVQAVTQIREWISSSRGTAPHAASPLAQSDAPRGRFRSY